MAIFRLFLGLFLLLNCMGCHKSRHSKAQKQSHKTLCLSLTTDIDTFDPRYIITTPAILPVKMSFEGLMCIGFDGIPHHAIAKSHEVSEDQLTYTFHLRLSKWSNGDPVTAYDFEYTWKTLLDPQLDTKGKHNLYNIKNAKAIVQRDLPVSALGVKAIDAHTLVVELEHPAPYFLEMAASSSFFPVNSKVDQETPGWASKSGKEFVCNGPFTLVSHKWDNEIKFVKNHDYWDAQHVQLPSVKIFIIKDTTTMLHLFEKQEIDWIGKPLSKLPLDAIPHLKKEEKMIQFPCAGLEWYFFNVNSFPFNNKKMRQAFTYAINRKAITDHILQEGETPALGILPHSLATQDTPFFEDNNTETALKLFNEGLSELGIEKKDFPPVVLNYSKAWPTAQKVAEEIQQQWQNVFDVKIKLLQLESKVHFSCFSKGDFQVGSVGWISWLHDPIYIMQTFRLASDNVNYSNWEHPEYQKLLSATEKELDPGKRMQLFNEAEKILTDEFPVAPIYYMTVSYVKNPRLQNVYVSDLYEIDFRWAYFDEKEEK